MYVGVILSYWYGTIRQTGVPHVCGGDPVNAGRHFFYARCSPCMWGWSWIIGISSHQKSVFPMYVGGWSLLIIFNQSIFDVFPMYVGVILTYRSSCKKQTSVPHVCGGDPICCSCFSTRFMCSPCMWGWSHVQAWKTLKHLVFPMYVGVILFCHNLTVVESCVPHVCGGDPDLQAQEVKEVMCSPCMWGGWSQFY